MLLGEHFCLNGPAEVKPSQCFATQNHFSSIQWGFKQIQLSSEVFKKLLKSHPLPDCNIYLFIDLLWKGGPDCGCRKC